MWLWSDSPAIESIDADTAERLRSTRSFQVSCSVPIEVTAGRGMGKMLSFYEGFAADTTIQSTINTPRAKPLALIGPARDLRILGRQSSRSGKGRRLVEELKSNGHSCAF